MKKVIKNPIFIFILSTIIFTGIGVIAANYAANTIDFTPKDTTWKKQDGSDIKTVKDALDDLYSKSNKSPVQVSTLTAQGATYTMQNDGYVTGTVQSNYKSASGILYLDNEEVFIAPWDSNVTYNVSIYVPKNSTIKIRTQYGTYNLTIYEFK